MAANGNLEKLLFQFKQTLHVGGKLAPSTGGVKRVYLFYLLARVTCLGIPQGNFFWTTFLRYEIIQDMVNSRWYCECRCSIQLVCPQHPKLLLQQDFTCVNTHWEWPLWLWQGWKANVSLCLVSSEFNQLGFICHKTQRQSFSRQVLIPMLQSF